MSTKQILIGSTLCLAVAATYYWWGHATTTNAANPDIASAPAATDSGTGKDRRGGKRGDRPQPVQVVQVKQADVPVIYRALGTAIPSAVVTVTSRVNGQLAAVLFDEGQLVKKGQLLANIDARPFESALGQIQGQAVRNQALLKNSQIDLERFKTLQSQDSIASQQVDAQASLVQQYQGTVQADRAAVEAAKLQVTFTQITAPVSGRIGLRQVDAGNNITTTNPIAVINAIQPIHVVFTIPEDQITALIQKIQLAGNRALKVEAWDKTNTKLLAKGNLASLDNQIDTTSGTLKLKAQFTNSDNLLFPNQFVNIRLMSETLHHASVIPLNALQHGPQGDFVYVITANRKDATSRAQPRAEQPAGQSERAGKAGRHVASVAVRTVTVGHNDGEIAAITAGLQAGEHVVISGVDKLKDGATVMVKSSDFEARSALETLPATGSSAADTPALHQPSTATKHGNRAKHG